MCSYIPSFTLKKNKKTPFIILSYPATLALSLAFVTMLYEIKRIKLSALTEQTRNEKICQVTLINPL